MQAKGPLVLVGAPVVRWVVSSAAFAHDVLYANQIAQGLVSPSRHAERIPQDVQLGFWLRSHPTLKYVALPKRFAWADYWWDVWDLDRLLLAHRVPVGQVAWLCERIARKWNHTPHLNVQLFCAGPPCLPRDCAHAPTQLACAAEVAMASPNRTHTALGAPLEMGCRSCECWEGSGSERASSGGNCSFSRTAKPDLRTQCWGGG